MTTSSKHDKPNGCEPREKFAKGLGWFSVGLGLAEIFAPRELARLVGVRNRPAVFMALGARELLNGVGILAQNQTAGWLWSRVAGDIMDLSLLGIAFTERGSDKERVEGAAGAVAGVMVADVICALQNSRETQPVRVEKVVAIDRSREELYGFWRKFENLPRFMRHLESVREAGQNRSHWVAKGPAGTSIQWDAEIVDDRPSELISWRSLPGADVENSGSVRFEQAPGNRGTFVRVKMEYQPPGGFFGATIAKMLGEEPEVQVQRDLYRFKQVMETGQVTTTEGQSAGRPSSTSPMYDTDNTRK
ncbi:MAG: SRPBCC family protein [Chthoniobacterales bacterium]|nr:SRPBCC family protein [Chthoniobacterales bacterium]